MSLDIRTNLISLSLEAVLQNEVMLSGKKYAGHYRKRIPGDTGMLPGTLLRLSNCEMIFKTIGE